MAAKKHIPPRLTDKEAVRAVEIIQGAIQRFGGSFEELESALGMYMLGHYVGWKVLVLMHSKRTIRKYEEILAIKVREEFKEKGSESERSLAFSAANALSNFWKVVSGEVKLDLERDERKHFKS